MVAAVNDFQIVPLIYVFYTLNSFNFGVQTTLHGSEYFATFAKFAKQHFQKLPEK